MSIPALTFSIFMLALLHVAYARGFDLTQRQDPKRLPQYHMLFATIRIIAALTWVGIYVGIIAESRDEALHFALCFMLMYLTMMLITTILKH